jgi:hypothetical protein
MRPASRPRSDAEGTGRKRPNLSGHIHGTDRSARRSNSGRPDQARIGKATAGPPADASDTPQPIVAVHRRC